MSKKTLVFGASLNPGRYSNIAIHRLLTYDHDVVAFGMKAGEVGNVEIDTELKSFQDVDTITLYMNPKRQEPFYDYLISLNPKRIIFNPGTENPTFYKLLREAHIPFEVACTLVLLGTNQY